MEDKYNQLSIDQYSRNLAKQLCDRHFAASQTIDGPALISFTPVKQINLFVLKELLVNWNREMASLKSPYFDFEDEAVKDALKQFMNVLSRMILMRRPHFEPLLEKAITDTFKLVLQPADILEEKFLPAQGQVTPEKIRENLKYIDLNKTLFTDFVDTLHPITYERKAVTDQFRLFTKAHFHDMVTMNDLVTLLNPLLPLSKNELTEGNTKEAAAPVASPVSRATAESLHTPSPSVAQAPVITGSDTFSPAPVPASGPVGAPVPEMPQNQPERRPVPEKRPMPEPVMTAVRTEPAPELPKPAAPVIYPPATQPAISGFGMPSDTPDMRLNEKFRTEKTTLNESLRKPEAGSIAAQQDNRKVETLKESISINQRFSFINELFTGENRDYHDAIAKLDSFPDADSAKNYLLEDLAGKYKWVKKEEHVNKLVRLIERKFS